MQPRLRLFLQGLYQQHMLMGTEEEYSLFRIQDNVHQQATARFFRSIQRICRTVQQFPKNALVSKTARQLRENVQLSKTVRQLRENVQFSKTARVPAGITVT